MKRKGVKVTAQRHDWDCGIASLAMLLGMPYGDVAAHARAVWGTTKPNKRGICLYHMEELAEAIGRPLKRIHKAHGYLDGQTGVIGLNGGAMSWAGHWAVLKAGAIVDPDGGEVWAVDDYLTKHKTRPATLLVEAC